MFTPSQASRTDAYVFDSLSFTVYHISDVLSSSSYAIEQQDRSRTLVYVYVVFFTSVQFSRINPSEHTRIGQWVSMLSASGRPYPHCAAYLLRDNDAPEVVDPSDNSGCFHVQNILSRGGGRIAHSGPRPPQGFSALAERRVAPAVPPRRTIAAWWGTWLLFEKATGIIPCTHILSGMVPNSAYPAI